MTAKILHKFFWHALVTFLITGFSAGSVVAAGYPPIYDLGWPIEWVDANRNNYEQVVYSFKPLYDLSDSRVVCNNLSTSCVVPNPFELKLYTARRDDYSYNFTIHDQFAIYIPPGTNNIKGFLLFTRQDSDVAVVARWGQPPTGTYSTALDYNAINASGTIYDFDAFRNKTSDTIVKPGGDIITIFPSDRSTSVNFGSGQGGWLYIKILTFSGSVTNLQYVTEVDSTVFQNWYNSVSWVNGEPPGNQYTTTDPEPTDPPPTTDPGTDPGDNTGPYVEAYDVNNDGVVNTIDAITIMRHLTDQ